MQVITLLNQKGGVGKTSCTMHLSGAFSVLGKRVLLVDNDPQSSLSQGFYDPNPVRDLDPAETVAAVYAGHRPFPSQVIRSSGYERIDLVPGSRAASLYNTPAPELAGRDLQDCLRDFLLGVEAEGAYDVVLIDCPPNLFLCSFAALVASRWIVVPLQPEDYGAQGIIDVQDSIELVQSGPNPALQLLGYLPTMVAREKIQEEFLATLREVYGDDMFAHVVPRSPVLKEAVMLRKPVAFYKKSGAPAKAILEVAREMLARMEAKSNPALAEVA